jgi:hypothetical protein
LKETTYESLILFQVYCQGNLKWLQSAVNLGVEVILLGDELFELKADVKDSRKTIFKDV